MSRKMAARFVLVLLAATLLLNVTESTRYEPNWASIDSRPLPDWYDKAKLGIFIHWGVFAVPSFSSEWFWWNWQGSQPLPAIVQFMAENYRPDFTYADFGPMLTAEFFDGAEWAKLFNASGAEYVVFVSKHHEGFTNWPSKYSFNWNAMDVGPKRDIVGELADAIRSNTKIHFGLYHSLFEWFHPLYLQDKANGYETQNFVTSKTMPELYEIVNRYKPEVIWSDGDWEAPDTYWNSTGFLAWLYNDSPVKDIVVTNDRWGKGITCHHGGYYTCSDRYNPGTLQKHKFENAMTIDKYSWGFRRTAPLKDYLTIEEIIRTLITTVSCGGNMLMNVGPEKDGRISPIFQERLQQLGQWLAVNGDAIYSSRPWTYQNDSSSQNIWYTSKPNDMGGTDVYATLLTWPTSDTLTLMRPKPSSTTTVTMLGYGGGSFKYSSMGSQGMMVTVPPISFNMLPCQWAWVLKITSVAN